LDATATPSRSGADTEARDAVLQHDLARDTCTPRRLGAHHRVGEFVFVPHDAGAAEDDGVLMGFVYTELAACFIADHGSGLLEAARHTRNCNQ
jgi:carotenoid cleavage dioxygenase-like enzyme